MSSELADSWAQEYTAGRQDLFEGMETEWDTIQRNLSKVQKESDISHVQEYHHQVRFCHVFFFENLEIFTATSYLDINRMPRFC